MRPYIKVLQDKLDQTKAELDIVARDMAETFTVA